MVALADETARSLTEKIGLQPAVAGVAENLLVYGRYFGMQDSEIEARIPSLLEFASLSHKRDAKVPTLSGGMKRRPTPM